MKNNKESNAAADALRADERIADTLYGDRHFDHAIKPGAEKLALEFNMTKEDREAGIRATARVFKDLELDVSTARNLFDTYATNVVDPPSPDTKMEWAKESRVYLKERFGDDAFKRKEEIHRYLQRREPTFLKALTETGLIDHPKFVQSLSEQIERFKRTGKIK